LLWGEGGTEPDLQAQAAEEDSDSTGPKTKKLRKIATQFDQAVREGGPCESIAVKEKKRGSGENLGISTDWEVRGLIPIIHNRR